MANLILPSLQPVFDLWDRLTVDPEIKKLDEFKGGAAWAGWHTRYRRSEHARVNRDYEFFVNRFNEQPSALSFFEDNSLRLTLFAGFERLFALRQAHDGLKSRFFFPDSNAGALQTMIVNGFFRGFFRGALVNLAHFFGATYQTFVWASQKSFSEQILASTVFETLFYPLDTVKTLLFTDIQGNYRGALECLGRTVQESGFTGLYRGLPLKLLYNVAFLGHLRNFYENNSLALITTPLWLFAYPLLMLKTRFQIADTSLSFSNLSDA